MVPGSPGGGSAGLARSSFGSAGLGPPRARRREEQPRSAGARTSVPERGGTRGLRAAPAPAPVPAPCGRCRREPRSRAGRAGVRWGCRRQPLVGPSQDCALAEGLRDGPRGRGKAARASLLPGAAAAAACCCHSHRLRCGAALESEALNGKPKAAVAFHYSCSKSRRLPVHLGRLRLWSSVMNPSCLRLSLFQDKTMYQGPCLCNCGGWLEVLICFLGSF